MVSLQASAPSAAGHSSLPLPWVPASSVRLSVSATATPSQITQADVICPSMEALVAVLLFPALPLWVFVCLFGELTFFREVPDWPQLQWQTCILHSFALPLPNEKQRYKCLTHFCCSLVLTACVGTSWQNHWSDFSGWLGGGREFVFLEYAYVLFKIYFYILHVNVMQLRWCPR